MQFCTDHSVHGGLVRALVATGADIITADALGPGVPDEQVLAFAYANALVLIAQDTDFGALVFQHARPSVGIVLMRFNIVSASHAMETAARILALPNHGRAMFTTLDEEGERSRPLP